MVASKEKLCVHDAWFDGDTRVQRMNFEDVLRGSNHTDFLIFEEADCCSFNDWKLGRKQDLKVK
jgi:hypothetical protein